MKNEILSIIKRNLSTMEGLTEYEKGTFTKILTCRTEPVPGVRSICDTCGTSHVVYKSCRNRLCPICNGSASIKWIAKREAEILPTGYFMLTFTLPSELRSLFLHNKKNCYDILFTCVGKTLSGHTQKNSKG